MTIRNFDDIHSIRKELRNIQSELISDKRVLSSVKRILFSSIKYKQKIIAAGTINVRENFKPIKETKEVKVAYSAIDQLNSLLTSRKDKAELAEHIHQLLENHFTSEDGAVINKLKALSKKLVEETNKLHEEATNISSEQGEKLAPKDFKNIVDDIKATIFGEFDTPPKSVKVKYYVGVDSVPIGDTKIKRLINMAYITIDNFQAGGNVRDLVIVVSRRKDNTNNIKYYVRTFTHPISPVSLMKNNLGVEFEGNVDRAMQIIMRALKVDNVIDVVEPSQIPVKKSDIKFENQNIMKHDIDEDNGVITFYLSLKIQKKEEADKVLQDIFVETKKIIKSIHPRNRNPVKATVPRTRRVKVKNPKTGEIKSKEQYYFKIMFSKPESGAAIELPRDKVKQFLRVLDIESPESAKEFNLLLKRFIG